MTQKLSVSVGSIPVTRSASFLLDTKETLVQKGRSAKAVLLFYFDQSPKWYFFVLPVPENEFSLMYTK